MENNSLISMFDEEVETSTETVESTEEVVKEETKDTNTETTENTAELTDTETEESKEGEAEEAEEKPKGKFYSDEELNKIISRRVSRERDKIEKKYVVYKDTENVLNKALGTSNINDANKKVREFYKKDGIDLPDKLTSSYTSKELETLGKNDAEEIMEDGYDAMVKTANELAAKKYDNLNPREKVLFKTLATELTNQNAKKELLKIGASEELLKDNDFIAFKNKFDKKTPIKEVYELYNKKNTKKQVSKIGSMKSNNNNVKKTYYTDEEIGRLTSEDFDKDPDLFDIVRKSMTSKK